MNSGSLVAARYRLVARRTEGSGTAYWQAADEVLQRPVGVRLVLAGSGRAAETADAARAAARVVDGRFLRVLDVGRQNGFVYVVSEWRPATSIGESLRRDGPLDPNEAGRVVAETAQALRSAHAVGVPHLALTPDSVLRTDTGRVAVLGLGVEAAAAGVQAGDPAAADARALGALLYAALTARWPDGPAHGLRPAPLEHGRLCSPRQVRAALPADLDDVADRILSSTPRHGGQQLRTPAAIVDALATSRPTPAVDPPPAPAESSVWPHRMNWLARTTAAMILVVGLGLFAWQVADDGLPSATGQTGAAAAPAPDSGAADLPDQPPPVGPALGSPGGSDPLGPGTVVRIERAADFDPEGDDEEHAGEVGYAIDGDPTTAWRTQEYYRNPALGGVKSGVGLLLDLGQPAPIGSVVVELVGRGTDVELRVGPSADASLDEFATVARVEGAGDSVRLRPEQPVEAAYVLLWLTRLPIESADTYRGGVSEVVVRR